tara:strand:- start:30942 stop:31694 length:753 start_codon:yes stop_codon:yes gene_type:complete
MNYLILEDEQWAAERLASIISELKPQWQSLGIRDSIKSAKAFLIANEVDLIFVDINLGDGLSFNLFQEIEVNCPLIFTTAYDQYAIKAFKLNSIDYLLKPINKEELSTAIKKLETKNASAVSDWQKVFNDLKPSYKERFLVSTGERLKTIKSSDISYFFAQGKHCFISDNTGREYLIDRNLKDLMEQLDPKSFFQINRQIIVNLNYIEEMHTYSKSRLKIRMQPASSQEMIVSVERSSRFRAWLEDDFKA